MSTKATVKDRGLSLEFRTNLFLGTQEMGEKILRQLSAAGGIFVPEFFDGGEPTAGKRVRFDPKDLGSPLKTWVHGEYHLGITAERHRPVKVLFNTSASTFLMFDHLGLTVCLDSSGAFDESKAKRFTNETSVRELLEVAKGFYEVTGANWGYVKNDFHEYTHGEKLDNRGFPIGYKPPKGRWPLQGLFWANFFGPEYVNMFGKSKLLSALGHRIEELSDGGLLLLLSDSPFEAFTPEYQARK